ncbi:MAG: hypothetical protein AAF456_08625 [Planctomycetota bacterium]
MANRRRRSRQESNSRNVYSALEPRQLLAGISLQSINGFQTVLIDGTGAGDVAEVNDVNGQTIEVQLIGETQLFSGASF